MKSMRSKKNKKRKNLFRPWESIVFSPYEWFTVIAGILYGLDDIVRRQPKTSKWRMDIRLYKVDRTDKPAKKGTRYVLTEIE